MALNYIQRGDQACTTVAPAGGIVSGMPFLLGDRVLVSLHTAAAGKTIEAATNHVYNVPKEASLVIAQGVDVYWDNTAKKITTTVGSNKKAGWCFKAAIGSESFVQVKFVN